MLDISADVANAVCKRFERDSVVCLPVLRDGLFTTTGFDNLDHNPSSTTSHDSLHGTAISIIQHPTSNNHGADREQNVIDGSPQQERKVPFLLTEFGNVKPVVMADEDVFAPPIVGTIKMDYDDKEFYTKETEKWVENASVLCEKDSITADEQPPTQFEPAITSLMPMSHESAHSVPMVLHGMNIVNDAIQLVNPGQVPVIAMDQPLFALAKTIQWKCPLTHGEDKFVIMFGGLHIELANLRALGKVLDMSGWTTVLTNANVASPGVVDSFVTASHITRTRRAHQITYAALHILQKRAYQAYLDVAEADSPLSFTAWKKEMSLKYPNLMYWSRVIELQLICFKLVKAFRVADFQLYLEALVQVMPWMFALDQINYARWLPVHIRDMQQLQSKCPEVHHHNFFYR